MNVLVNSESFLWLQLPPSKAIGSCRMPSEAFLVEFRLPILPEPTNQVASVLMITSFQIALSVLVTFIQRINVTKINTVNHRYNDSFCAQRRYHLKCICWREDQKNIPKVSQFAS